MKLSILREAVWCLLIPACLVLGPGCSYAFVHGPPAGVPTSETALDAQPSAPSCNSSNAAPIVDTVLGSALVGFGGVVAIGSVASHSSAPCTGFCVLSNDSSWEEAGIAVGVGAIALGTLFLASAVTGYGRTADCRRLEESLPDGPHPSARHLLDLNGIVAARAREEAAGQFARRGPHLPLPRDVLGSAPSSDRAGGSREMGTWTGALR